MQERRPGRTPCGWPCSVTDRCDTGGHGLDPNELELYRRCDEILHYVWDPIGVADVPEARDEYFDYLPRLLRNLLDGDDEDGVAAYLINVETESMGLESNGSRAWAAADLLIRWRDYIATMENL